MSTQRSHRPWPIKWIVLVILLAIGPYTFLRWHYRKPGPAFAPYHDMKEQANTRRLVAAGFQRVTIDAERPAEPLRNSAAAPLVPAAGGLPEALALTLVDQPLLPTDILSVIAAPVANTMFSYPIELTCTLPDNKQQLAGAHLYVRDDEIIILPLFERLNGELLARTRDNLVRLTVPPGVLMPRAYRVTLVGARSSRTWALEVR